MNHSTSPHSLKQRLGGRNLYLVGMMGSGKSRTGPPLAKQLAYGFVDMDVVIEKAVNMPISKIFEKEGETGFREIESQVLTAIGERHSLVVATGGGVVTCQENWGVLHQGIVIWLDPGRERLINRLKADSVKRPLLIRSDPDVAFDQLLEDRLPLYSEADLHLTVDNESPEGVAQRLLAKLPSILSAPEGLDVQQTTEW